MKRLAKIKQCKSEEQDYELVYSNAETTIDHYSLEQILNDIDDGSIIDDIPTQRDANQWAKKDKSLLIHTVLLNLSILPISMVQCGTGSGAIKKLIDGKQRTSIFNQFRNNEFALSKMCPPIRMRRVVQVEKRDENGNVVMTKSEGRRKPTPVMIPKTDENGNIVTEEFNYKVAGKYFSELPDSLKKQFNRYKNMPQYVHINYTPEEIQLQMLRDNTSVKMTPAQVGIVVCGDELAKWLHSFREHDLFLNCSTWKGSQEIKSLIERCVTEAFILSSLNDKWSDSYSVNVETFKANSAERMLEAFEDLVNDFTDVIKPYDELKSYLTKDNLHIILAAYCNFCDLDIRYEKRDFAKFLCKWFEEIKDTTEYETDGNAGTKKKTTVLRKLSILNEECIKYMEMYATEDNEMQEQENLIDENNSCSSEKEELGKSTGAMLEDFITSFGTNKEEAVCALMELDNRSCCREDFSSESLQKYIDFFSKNPSQYLIDECLKIQDKILNISLSDETLLNKYNMPILMKLYYNYVDDTDMEDKFADWIKAFADLEEPAFVEIGGKMFEDYILEGIDQTSNVTILSKYAILQESFEQYIKNKRKEEQKWQF